MNTSRHRTISDMLFVVQWKYYTDLTGFTADNPQPDWFWQYAAGISSQNKNR